MATICVVPEHIKRPELDRMGGGLAVYHSAIKTYRLEVVEYCRKHGSGDLRGEIISFAVRDGSASYVIFNDTTLIYLDFGDGYELSEARATALNKIELRLEVRKNAQIKFLFPELAA